MDNDNVVLVDDCSPLETKTEESPNDTSTNVNVSSPRKRSRSRSPNHRQHLYESEGTNTTSDDPELQRARLFVGNVDNRISRGELKRTFSRYGEVLGVSIHKGFAFVQLDSENNAKEAIIGEDSRHLNGSLLYVEFSQAAKRAGAKYKEVEEQVSKRRSSSSSSRPPPPRSRSRHDYEYEELRDREAKLARVLAMEKELAYYQSQDRYSRRPPDHYDRRSRRDFSPPPRDYDRSYRGRDHFYGRSSPPLSSKSGMGSYRDSFSSKPRLSGYESRDYGFGRNEQNVGYGGSSGGRDKSPVGSSLGWPSSNYSKSQRPFSGSGSWN